MAEGRGVLVHCETDEGRLTALSTEVLSAGYGLAQDLGEKLSAVLIGSGVAALAQEAVAWGADEVFVVDEPWLGTSAEAHLAVMASVVARLAPKIVLCGQTPLGRDLAPRLAFRLDSAATLDCVALAIDPASRRLLQTKPVYGGNAQAVFTCESDPQIATVRSKAMSPRARDSERTGEIVTLPSGIDPSSLRVRVVEEHREDAAGVKLEEAEVIVAGGRGMGGAESFGQLEELARLLRGAVGASRPPCDNGWVPDGMQIGLTGKIVAPDLYIAVGLSGSSQHLSGCSGAKTIVALNKDPEANVFKVAHYGVLGDWTKTLPAFTAKVKELVAE